MAQVDLESPRKLPPDKCLANCMSTIDIPIYEARSLFNAFHVVTTLTIFGFCSELVCASGPCTFTRSKGHGRITRKDLRMHKLVFEEDVQPDGTELSYDARGQKLLQGYKKGCAIFCFCCQTEVAGEAFHFFPLYKAIVNGLD